MEQRRRRFSNLRGVRWRIDLGILPSSPAFTAGDLRRAAADSRRRYAVLRRRLLVDPHLLNDPSSPSDLADDNPLSQNPESTWGRFFRNAELERTVDQDVSRLHPDEGSYLRTPPCQAMLRRILLIWVLEHSEFGYRQGMHELLAPLMYVLSIDLNHLSLVRSTHEDVFSDCFDNMTLAEIDAACDRWIKKGERSPDIDPAIREIFELSDAYGAEGELGIILSEKFIEHDAYAMFDSLMGGTGRGVVSMAELFAHSPAVIEASCALYHVLSCVDPPLHSHLVGLDVEPQYFALRWLRVLFGREFHLDNLLLLWDEVFARPDDDLVSDADGSTFKLLRSARGSFVASLAVAMLIHIRSLLLSTENATVCLQRLLNFPQDVNVGKLIEKAELFSVQASSHEAGCYGLPVAVFTTPPDHQLPANYWEEKWRDMLTGADKAAADRNMMRSLRRRFGLSRTKSAPVPEDLGSRKEAAASVRRRLLDDLSVKAIADDNGSEKSSVTSNSCTSDSIESVKESEDAADEAFSKFQPSGDGISSESSTSSRCSDGCSKEVIETLKGLGQSMLENIRVIELAVESESGAVRGGSSIQRTEVEAAAAAVALKELRRISRLLNEL